MGKTQVVYRQCRLFHPATRRVRVAWIPNQLARRTQILDVEGQEDWVVNTVFDSTLRTLGDFESQRQAQKHFQGSSGQSA